MLRRLSSLVLGTNKGSAGWSWKLPTFCQYSVSGGGNSGSGGGNSGSGGGNSEPVRDIRGKRIGQVKKGPPLHEQDNAEALEFLGNLDDIMKLKKQRIDRELEEARLLNDKVPENIEPYQWKILLTETYSKTRRMKFLKYLFGIERRKLDIKIKKKQEVSVPELPKAHRMNDHLTYPNRERFKLGPKYACYNSMVLGNPIVFDMDYPADYKEETQQVSQTLMCYGENLKHPFPFHLYFTGYKDVRFDKHVKADLLDEHMFATFHEGCFTDLFDSDRLVYLTPDGPLLPPFDADKVYVIGGMVDLKPKQKLSLGKAKKLGIQYGRFPLDRYVRLETSRLLTLTSVLKIMLHANLTKDWEQAILEGLPKTQYRRISKREQEENRQKKQFRHDAYRNTKRGSFKY